VPDGDLFVVEGNLFEVAGVAPRTDLAWGVSTRAVSAFEPGDTADLGDGQTLTSRRTATMCGAGPTRRSTGGASASSPR
jgi:alpha-glucoside transport system permease protein